MEMFLLVLPLLDSGRPQCNESTLPRVVISGTYVQEKLSHLRHSDVMFARLTILSHQNGNIEASHGNGSGISSG